MPKAMLKFNEETHQYTLGRKKLISVTQLLEKFKLAPNYDNVGTDVLQKKAKRGTLIHKEIETYIKDKTLGISDEVDLFADYIKKNKIKPIHSELQVHNDIVAGTIDLIIEQNGELIVADIKTTYQIHYLAVTWQISIYAYLYAKTIEEYSKFKGQVYHFTKEGTLDVVNIKLVDYEQVDKLIDAERNNVVDYTPIQLNIDETQMAQLISLENYLKTLDEEKTKIEKQEKIIKELLFNEMQERGLSTFENEYLKVTLVKGSIKTSIDTSKLKEEKPNIYKKYSKTSTTNPYIKITLKDVKNAT